MSKVKVSFFKVCTQDIAVQLLLWVAVDDDFIVQLTVGDANLRPYLTQPTLTIPTVHVSSSFV